MARLRWPRLPWHPHPANSIRCKMAKQDVEIAKMRVEIQRLKRTVEILTGERGTGANKAVLQSEFDALKASIAALLAAAP